MPLESEPGDAISTASWGNLRLVRATLPASGEDYPALAAQQDAPGGAGQGEPHQQKWRRDRLCASSASSSQEKSNFSGLQNVQHFLVKDCSSKRSKVKD